MNLGLEEQTKFSTDVVESLRSVYGDEVLKVVDALKTPGRKYYFRANTLKADPNELEKRLERRGLEVKAHATISEAFFVHVEGPFDVPVFEKKVKLDKFAAESVLQGAHVYAPGVKDCRKLKKGENVTLIDEFGQVVASGVARMSETEILRHRRGLAVEVISPRFRVPSFRELKEFADGLLYPQSLPAMLTSLVLDPQPGETVLDIGASPGGKTSHMSALMEGQGRILAVDRNVEKMASLRETLGRLGAKNVETITEDARYLDLHHPNLRVDRACVDVSCSSLGVRPKLFEKTTKLEIVALANYQKQFLKVASKILKRGGVLVYSTCTMTLEENEEIMEYAVSQCGFEAEEQDVFLGSPGVRLSSSTEFSQRFHPHIHDAPGYFIARMVKKN